MAKIAGFLVTKNAVFQMAIDILCMQMSFDTLYKYFLNSSDWTDIEDKNNIFNENDMEKFHELLEKKFEPYTDGDKLDKKQSTRIFNFIQELRKLIISEIPGESKELDSQRLESFEHILTYSSIVSRDNVSSSTSDYSFCALTEKVKGLKVLGIRVGKKRLSMDETGKEGMAAAFVWAIEDLCKKSDKAKAKLESILEGNNLAKAKLSERVFAPMLPEEKRNQYINIPKASIKKINGTNVTIVTHYSANDLRSNLVRLLKYLEADIDDYELIVEQRKE